jgi:hypothetical protein
MVRVLTFSTALSLFCAASVADANEIAGGPVAVIVCPAKGKTRTVIDVSTGVVPWISEGPGLPIQGKAMATPIDEAAIPQSWNVRIPGARWVQAQPQSNLAAHAPEPYIFAIEFVVKKAKRMPQLSLTGQVTADEALDLNLIEPSAANQHISSGLSYGDDTPGVVEQAAVQLVDLHQSGEQNGKALGQRSGTYRLQIGVENGSGPQATLGLLAKLKLVANCGGK